MPSKRPPDRMGGEGWAGALAEHAGWLRAAVSARLGERQGVEEVLQEVALAAVGPGAPAVGATNPGAWLYRVAVRQVLLYRRKAGRRRRLAEGHARHAEGAKSAGGDPLGWLLDQERGRLVREAMARLPARDAEMLTLKYAEGLTAAAIADRLGLGVAAVEARLHRARGRLRGLLAGVIDGGDGG